MKKDFVNLGVSFKNILNKYSKNTALQFSLEEKYTYLELNHCSEIIVKLFKRLKIKKNNIIAIESDKNIITYSIIVACWKLGIIYSFFDTDDNSERIKKIFKIL